MDIYKYIYDAMYDDYLLEKEMEDLYDEVSKEAIAKFRVERLQSFYRTHPHLTEGAFRSLAESRQLLAGHPSAALVLAATAIEVGLKVALLKPIAYGIVHAESFAEFIAELAFRTKQFKIYKNLCFQILSEYGGVDLNSFRREGVSTDLWQEITAVQQQRNKVLHLAEPASEEDAGRAVEVASTILDSLFPKIINNLGLHLHEGGLVCNKSRCKVRGRSSGAHRRRIC